MAKGTITIEVGKPPEQVFAYVADLENAPQWVPDLVSVTKISDGEVRVGTRYAEIVQMGSKQGDAKLEITEYDPPRVFGHNGQGGPSRFTARFLLEASANGGTHVTHEYTVRMTGIFKLMSPLINGWVRKNTEAAMQNLKRELDR